MQRRSIEERQGRCQRGDRGAPAAEGAPGAWKAGSWVLGPGSVPWLWTGVDSNLQASCSRKFAPDRLFVRCFQNKSPSFVSEQTRLVAAADPLCSDVRIAGPPLADARPNMAAPLRSLTRRGTVHSFASCSGNPL